MPTPCRLAISPCRRWLTSPERLLTLAVIAAVAALAATAQQPQFAHRSPRQVESWDLSVVAGDVDGDGDVDLILGGQRQLYLNDGRGLFDLADAGRLPPWQGAAEGAALVDLDGDGDLDLVFATTSGLLSQRIQVLLNDGRGRFTDVTSTVMPAQFLGYPSCVVAGDIDGDGDMDLVFGLSGQNRLFRNQGGMFVDATAQLPVLADATVALQLVDLDGDGDLDLLVGNRGQQSRLLRNNGSGVFTDVTLGGLPLAMDWTLDVHAVDVDGDGLRDLVFANVDAWQQGSPPGQSRLLRNQGGLVFTEVTATHLPNTVRLAVRIASGDFDQDGRPDLVLDGNTLLLNTGGGVFVDATAGRLPDGGSIGMAVADFDGDRAVDLFAGTLCLNDGSGRFRRLVPPPPTFAANTRRLVVGDLDGDGIPDVVTGGDRVRLYRNDGRRRFVERTSTHLPDYDEGVAALVLGDLDGDRDLDLVVATNDKLRVLHNDGRGRFVDRQNSGLPRPRGGVSVMLLLDNDGDGDLDLLVADQPPYPWREPGLRLFHNDGTGRFTEVTAQRLPSQPLAIGALVAGDFDGDGDLDLLVGARPVQVFDPYTYAWDTLSGKNRIYANDGTGHYGAALAGDLPPDLEHTLHAAAGDVDGDGLLDVVLAEGFVGQWVPQLRLKLHRNLGGGVFADETASRLPGVSLWTNTALLVDLDGDGHLDLLGGGTGMLWNDGTGHFLDAGSRLPSDRWITPLACHDMDGDGDVDLLTEQNVFRNLLREVELPLPLVAGRDLVLDVYARYGPLRQSDVALPWLATAAARVPVPGLGVLGIDLAQAVALPPLPIPQPLGRASLVLPIPNQPALVGLELHTQAVLLQLPLQVVLTNATSASIER